MSEVNIAAIKTDYNWGAGGLLNDLKKILLRSSETMATKYGLSIINVFQNDLDEAVTNLTYLIENKPDVGLIHRRLGELFILRSEHEKALPHLEKAVELDSEDLTALTWLSLTYYRLGETEKAIKRQDLLEESAMQVQVTSTW